MRQFEWMKQVAAGLAAVALGLAVAGEIRADNRNMGGSKNTPSPSASPAGRPSPRPPTIRVIQPTDVRIFPRSTYGGRTTDHVFVPHNPPIIFPVDAYNANSYTNRQQFEDYLRKQGLSATETSNVINGRQQRVQEMWRTNPAPAGPSTPRPKPTLNQEVESAMENMQRRNLETQKAINEAK